MMMKNIVAELAQIIKSEGFKADVASDGISGRNW